jgi:hypothetical protein
MLFVFSEFSKKVEEFKKKEQEEKKLQRDKGAMVVQKLMRGVLARKKFRKNLPNLKKQQRFKILCSQCEMQIALKRCRQCKDRYCNECYDMIHSKGNRKNHSWENVKIDARMVAMAYENNNSTSNNMNATKVGTLGGVAASRHGSMYGSTGGAGAGAGMQSTRPSMMSTPVGMNTTNPPASAAGGGEEKKKINPKDWEEFYDESARAKYWYNKKTGEASWINPFK